MDVDSPHLYSSYTQSTVMCVPVKTARHGTSSFSRWSDGLHEWGWLHI